MFFAILPTFSGTAQLAVLGASVLGFEPYVYWVLHHSPAAPDGDAP